MVKKALITGVTGQDGSYLSEHLLKLGYQVHGTIRRISTSQDRLWRIREPERIFFHAATLESQASLVQVVRQIVPDECYHLASQSDVRNSFEDGFSTMNMNINGTHYLLEAIRLYAPGCRFYFAGSSEMFGGIGQRTQNERTPFHPRSPYAISKVAGFHLTAHYREAYGMYAASGILFNHESPRRGLEFVTRKIAVGVAAIKRGKTDRLFLGDLSPERDWGYAPEYVRAMHKIINQEQPEDFVIATNETHSVQEFVEEAFDYVDLDWSDYVKADRRLLRPCEVMRLKGDYAKASRVLGWKPKITFPGLVRIMVDAELARA